MNVLNQKQDFRNSKGRKNKKRFWLDEENTM